MHSIDPIEHFVELFLVDETLFHKEMISAKFIGGNVLHRGELQIDTINFNFINFESARYMKSAAKTNSLVYFISVLSYQFINPHVYINTQVNVG